jgi:chromosomal replication initiator protein
LTTRERDAVSALGRALALRIGEPRYNLWFERKTKFTLHDGQLVVGVPNHFVQDWLQAKFAEDVRIAAREVFEHPVQVRFSIDPQLFQASRSEQAATTLPQESAPVPHAPERPVASKASTAKRQADDKATAAEPSAKRSRRWHRLGDFVVGSSNRVAHASALSVVEAPGQGANPLVIHGPVGTGKTHLLEGIYVGLRKRHAQWRVGFLGAEDFTNRFLHAMHAGKLVGFRKQFRSYDALLVDDLHFLAGKKATQEEFLHTFDALLADSRQVVVTCDLHPRLADSLTPELTDRLLGGAVWPLLPPEPETRLALLRAKAVRAEVLIPEEVLAFLAGQLRGNVRELEGALHSVQHYSRVTGRPIDLALTRDALSELLRHAVRVVQLEDVDHAVCRALRLETGALQSRQRAWAVSHPRMLAMFLARKHTRAATSEVGQHFGGRNHSTVVAAEKKVRQWLAEDAELALGDRPVRIRQLIELVERELFR